MKAVRQAPVNATANVDILPGMPDGLRDVPDDD